MTRMFPCRRVPRPWLANGVFYLIILAAAFWLKSFYSRADTEELGWMLRPVAWTAAAISGTGFSAETGAGFVSDDRRFVIAPACAGINFLIIAFVTAACAGVHRFKGPAGKALWTAAGGLSAFGLAVGVNGLRVVLSMHLYETGIRFGPLTPDRIHRIQGAVLYLSALYLFHGGISRMPDFQIDRADSGPTDSHPGPIRSNLQPLIWYLAVVIGAPLLNAGYRRSPEQFLEHAGTILAVSLGVWLLMSGVRRGCHRVRKRLRSFHITA